MLKKIITVVFVSIIVILQTKVGYALNSELATALLNSTVLISWEVESGKFSFGSGFLIFNEIENGNGHVFLITNKHVIPPPIEKKSIIIRVIVRNGESANVQNIEVPIVGDNKQYLPIVRLHPNDAFDVVAINITDLVKKYAIQASWLPSTLLVTKQKMIEEGITVGDGVLLLGYPNAIFDERNASPLMRQGIIATEPTKGYAFNERLRKNFGLPSQIDGFLIDANVFPGSSGSVVLFNPQATTIGPHGETVVSSQKKIPYILGIISGSIPIQDNALNSVQRMGLGTVYSAETIRQTIDLFYKPNINSSQETGTH